MILTYTRFTIYWQVIGYAADVCSTLKMAAMRKNWALCSSWEYSSVYKTTARDMCNIKQAYVQGGSNMTGTNCDLFTHESVPVISEPPCIFAAGA